MCEIHQWSWPNDRLYVDIWKQIEIDEGLEVNRSYIADVKTYDARALARENIILDIYMGCG
jgi:hypothetical protein